MKALVETVKINFKEACVLEQERKDLESQIDAKSLCADSSAPDYRELADVQVKEMESAYRRCGLPPLLTGAGECDSPKSAVSDFVHLDLARSRCLWLFSTLEFRSFCVFVCVLGRLKIWCLETAQVSCLKRVSEDGAEFG